MMKTRSIPALALLGMAILGGPATVYAADEQNAVRQELLSKCDGIQGRIHGICVVSMTKQMQNYDAQATVLYKACLDSDNPRSVCDEQKARFWENLVSAE